MSPDTHLISRIALLGIAATVTFDAWQLLLRRVGVPSLDMALLGRWIGHLGRLRWRHAAIARAAPVQAERAIGWIAHYAIGVAFALGFIGCVGPAWLTHPTLGPAMAFGAASVAAPWLVMQPAMGAGIASSRTRTPWRNATKSLASHLVFGIGLYAAARLGGMA